MFFEIFWRLSIGNQVIVIITFYGIVKIDPVIAKSQIAY